MMIYNIYIFIISMLSFSLNRKHLLTMLLSLEFVVLSLFFMMYSYFINFNYEFYFVLIFLTMSVCESALGLALMVSLIRSYGNDYFVSLNMLW
uniref:NADH-ubiquinone oxidoreductase chain 4L n=1 Tax=Aiolocaria hexaspilota TaxID=419962 RepID=A0A4P8GA41_9CUCU|nr:NADH dehydrogenase subunit 4L [Aiolocaria hexaspilota]QCO91584.1 NADH dehydrogenase subunit 4L [Aiolocaria hexaspilota]UXW88374.1 NADH dehydrogenase subunit 4L [Aiolocaria hexaspilota]